MEINFDIINKKKIKEKENSKLLEKLVKDYLSDYCENIEFDYNFGRDGLTLLAKEVEFRKDWLQKFGIPLEWTIGKIKMISWSVKSLIALKNLKMDISDIYLEVQTIHISKDYKKNYLTHRQKWLNEWEDKHKSFFDNLSKQSIVESYIVNKLMQIKIEVKNIKIKINDSISSITETKQIEIKIYSIRSICCNHNFEETDENDAKDNWTYRKSEINGFGLTVNRIYNEQCHNLGILWDELNMVLNTSFIRTTRKINLNKIPKLSLGINFTTSFILNWSVENIEVLQNLTNYWLHVKNVEKYWVNRPEFHEEDKINKADSLKWFWYAFRVWREEIRNNKRQNYDWGNLIDKLISMEKYIQFYKESHNLIIAPWIHQKDHKVELQNLEKKMTLDDIIYCREIAFAELLTEGRAFCASGEVGEGYKPFVHLWEFYVNDLRTKWMNNKEEKVYSTIKLNERERREWMSIWKNDRDMVLLSYIKGEPNHPFDILLKFKLNIESIIINFSRTIDFTSDAMKGKKYRNQIDYFSTIYTNTLSNELSKKLTWAKATEKWNESSITAFLQDELKNQNNNESDDEAIVEITNNSRSHEYERTNSWKKEWIVSTRNQDDDSSCWYIDEIEIKSKKNENENVSDKDNSWEIKHVISPKNKKIKDTQPFPRQPTKMIDNNSIQNDTKIKKKIYSKTWISIFIFSTSIDYWCKRDTQTEIEWTISTIEIFDHNYTYLTINENHNYLINKQIDTIFAERIKTDAKNNITEKDKNWNEVIFRFLIEILRHPKSRKKMLKQSFKLELEFFLGYEDCFGFKKCDIQGQGWTSLQNHFQKIVIDYWVNKNVFHKQKEIIKSILISTNKKKFEKWPREEKEEELNILLKKVIIKAFQQEINPEKRHWYETEIKTKFIEAMIRDWNTLFEASAIHLLKHVISSIYSFYITSSQFSRILSNHIKSIHHLNNINQDAQTNLLYLTMKKRGNEYPNYIMQRDSDFVETKNIDNDEPNISATIAVNKRFEINLTNEVIAELQIAFDEKSDRKIYSYAGNILEELTRSYLTIFDDFRQWRAKLAVLNEVNKKYKTKENENEPIEMIYLNKLKPHLKELIEKNINFHFEMKNDINIRIYDKIAFLDNEKITSFGWEWKNITIKNANWKTIPAETWNVEMIPLPENYDLGKLLKIWFYSELTIESIEISIDYNEPVLRTDLSINKIYSLMGNTLFIPDSIIDWHANKVEVNIYPCWMNLWKNVENINFYKDWYSSHLEKIKNFEEWLEQNNNKIIIQSNFERFIRIASTCFNEKCQYNSGTGNENSTNSPNNWEFYLEKRNNEIIIVSIGSACESNNNCLLINYYNKDKSIQKQEQWIKQRHSVKPGKLKNNINTNIYSAYTLAGNQIPTISKINQINTTILHRNSDNTNNSANISPFFSWKCNWIVFSSITNLFYTQSEWWICPVLLNSSDTSFEKFQFHLSKGNTFKCSSNHFLFCRHFINSLQADNIIIDKLSTNFPYDNVIQLKDINLNLLFKKTTFFYEESKELNKIYWSHFKDEIGNYSTAEKRQFWSNMKVNIDSIMFQTVLKNNTDLIDWYYNIKTQNNFIQKNKYINEQFKVYITKRAPKHIKEKKFYDNNNQHRSSTKKKTISLIQAVSVHAIEISINSWQFKLYYDIKTMNNLLLLLTVKAIIYRENYYQKQWQTYTKSDLCITSVNVIMEIPKNFRSSKTFEDDSRLPIWDKVVVFNTLKAMETNAKTKNERIIFNVGDYSMKLFDTNQVKIEIGKTIELGFSHGLKANEIDEYILLVVPYANGSKKELNYVAKQMEKVVSVWNEIKNPINKSLEIVFDKRDVKERDEELNNYKDINQFACFNKMIYIISSTFAFKLTYIAGMKMNICIINAPNKVYHYAYYIGNWMEEIKEMIMNKRTITEQWKEFELFSKLEYINNQNEILNFDRGDSIDSHNASFTVPWKDSSNSWAYIMTIECPIIFGSLIQDDVNYTTWIFIECNGEWYKDSNNETLFHFSSIDWNWKADECNCNTLVIKKNTDDWVTKIFEVTFIINQDEAWREKDKGKHKLLIIYRDCKLIYLQRCLGDLLDFFDYNEICSYQNPKKDDILSLWPKPRQFEETYFFILDNCIILLPEDSKSHNYIAVHTTTGSLQIAMITDNIKMLEMPNKNELLHVIDKRAFFGIDSQNVNNMNTMLSDISSEDNLKNQCLFYITQWDMKWNNIKAYIHVDSWPPVLYLEAKKGNMILRTPKNSNPVTKIYEHYWNAAGRRIVRMKNTIEVDMTDANINLSMGDFYSFDHIMDNNFDEKSLIFKEREAIFSSFEYEIIFPRSGNLGVDIFKVFNEFFDKSEKIERIGVLLPGHDNPIDYDTNM